MKNRQFAVRLSACLLVLLCVASSGVTQTVSQTGLPPWTPFDSDSFSNVNLASLNVHIEIPLRSLPGRSIAGACAPGYRH